jgi:hypothetical protein
MYTQCTEIEAYVVLWYGAEYKSTIFIWNVGTRLFHVAMPYRRRIEASTTVVWKLKDSYIEITEKILIHKIPHRCPVIIIGVIYILYRAFHNVLHDYKHL